MKNIDLNKNGIILMILKNFSHQLDIIKKKNK